MAEVLGIVTGSIAHLEVAGRLGGRVLKLKQLFDELKEVPDTIRSLMEQVAVVEPIRLKSSKWKKKTRWTSKTQTTVWSFPYALSVLGEYSKSEKSSTFTSVSSSRASIAPPKWLVGRCWDFCLSNASNGWDFGLRTYQVVDYRSDVFQCIDYDDVLGLQRLFEARAASPFSVD
ncbi:hypothetical protein HYQ45_009191 [Verticillium longisporum]|uniref:Fungal N-terminal domain-containing protein n=1 Tax=Verticillium longisporum TaxID=100787 RepID=A0A8I2ZIQ4_VERLO|nr:hypothetical protein HYQ45_009191 [Verticillium longisporum]